MITMGEAEDYLGHVTDALAVVGLTPTTTNIPDTDELAEDGIPATPSAVLTWDAGHPSISAALFGAGLLAAWSSETGWSHAALRPDGSNQPRTALDLPVFAEPGRIAAVLARVALGQDGDVPVLVLTDGTRYGWHRQLVYGDDPAGWIAHARDAGYLESMLAALGDPMDHAQVRADDLEAAEQLRAVSWAVDRLTHRRDALIVALKGRGLSWAELARLTDADEPDPARLRTKVRRRHEAGQRRAGLLPQDEHGAATEAVLIGQIMAAVRRGDTAAADRLVEHLLRESVDLAATEARVQAAISQASRP
ncbi:hypothetical protein [Kitasatospora sp. NPDC006786]|uniref:hypothetical protein n=1 Tax=unclassified Kitasatospora TaxID=2633591 RepID=UPI0034017C31